MPRFYLLFTSTLLLRASLLFVFVLCSCGGCDTHSKQAGQVDKSDSLTLSVVDAQQSHSQKRDDDNAYTAPYTSPSPLKLPQVDGAPRKYRALLIGCTRYDDRRITPLRGPVNDVELMRDVLMDKFDFRLDNSSIVILSERAGQHDADLRPTRENIVRELDNLAQAAYEEGAQVVIHFSGHGGRQRDTNGDELDGFDEVFCPADTKRLSEDGGVESGGITDDEIHGWLDRIAQHSSVWMIADSCHSGTLTRGAADGVDVPRAIGRSPSIHEEMHRETLATRAASDTFVSASAKASRASSGKAKHPIVAFYAAPPTLETYDTEFDGVPYGLFTYTVCKVLRQSEGKLSYRRLIQGVFDQYVKMRRSSPTPQIEAANKDIEVLGHRELRGSEIQLRRSGDRYWVTAGRLHDVTDGTMLAVYSGDQSGNSRPNGYVRVVSTEMLSAQVEPCSSQGVQWENPNNLPTDGFCEVASANFKGLRKLAVAVDSQTVSGQRLSAETHKHWRDVVDGINSNEKSLVTVVDHPHEADWVVQVADPSAPEIIYVLPTKRFMQQGDEEAGFTSPTDKESEPWLQDTLNDIARTCNLVEIAQYELKKSTNQIDLDIQLRWRGVDGKYETAVDQGPDLKIHHGSRLGVYVRNPNPFAVYVTVLFVNSKCQTKAWLPRENHPEHRLERSGELGDSFIPVKFTVKARATGLDRVVAIAIKERPQGQQPDLTFLASRTAERTRSKRAPPKPPLEELLAASVFGIKRGDAVLEEDEQQLDDHTFRVLSWQTVKKVEHGKGWFGGPKVGPPEDLGAKIVEAGGSRYHTAGRTKAILGTYGELVHGKVLQYEPYTKIAESTRVRSFNTVDKVGRASGSALLSIAGQGRIWEILNISGEVAGEDERQLHFEVIGTRLDKADVIDALNRDRRAMSFFSMLTQSQGVPCVILESIRLPRFEATRRKVGSGNADARLSDTNNRFSSRFDGERTSFVAFRSPVIRCYQMYRVKLARVEYRDQQGQPRTSLRVVKLEPIEPKS